MFYKKILKVKLMINFKNILRASTVVGSACGLAYYYLKRKGQSRTKVAFEIGSNNNELLQPNEMLTAIGRIDELSSQICSNIKLETLTVPIHKSISGKLFDKWYRCTQNKRNELKNVLWRLSFYTKDNKFLLEFHTLDGWRLLQELLSEDGLGTFLDEEIIMIISEVLANISRTSNSIPLITSQNVIQLLSSWKDESNIITTLNRIKILKNLQEFGKQSEVRSIFPPDLFLLDADISIDESKKSFDVVFINGMLGSVFFTWRQHDDEGNDSSETTTKCWPRDWLSVALPEARIIGINAHLRPFIWNSMSSIDKINRSMEARAAALKEQLAMAGVGRRPVVWVTHSAGGILVKYILRQSQQEAATSGCSLAAATRAVLFMSTPHSGAQSLLGLYYFPFKYLLTPEAKHLETNSQSLLDLQEWFKVFSKDNQISILTLTETEPTRINKFYSTLIVPKHDTEFESHCELEVKSNHLYISKPRNELDQIYLAVLDFVKETFQCNKQ